MGTAIDDCVFDQVVFTHVTAPYLEISHLRNKGCLLKDTQLPHSYWINCQMAKTTFTNCLLSSSEFSQTSLAGVDLSTDTIDQLRMNPNDIKGAIIDASQAIDLIGLLEVTVT